MNELDVRRIVYEILRDGQYGVPKAPDHIHNGLDTPKIPFTSLINNPNHFCVATNTNGTTAVNIFGSGGALFNATITGVFLVSKDTTAGNITLANNGTSVCVIAKGTTSGALVGATSLLNTSYVKATPITVVSSSVGNSTLFMTYTS